MARFKMTFADYDSEISGCAFPSTDLTAGNFDAENTAALAVQAAVEAVVRGKLLQTELVAKTSPHGVGAAASKEAQREEKALVQYYDSITFKRATLELPCVDMTKQNPDYPGVFYIAGGANNHADWEAFNTAFVAFVSGPSGNAPVIERVVHVGRNL